MREGWKEVKFGEVVEFPPKIKMVKGNKYPFIPMELIDGGYKYVKPIEEKELAGGGAKFEEGDTLFARITPCLQNGKIAQAKNLNNKPGFGSTEYFIFRGIPNVTENDYVYYLSQMKEFRDNAINSMVGASGRQRADAGHVKSFVFNLPPLETQKKIASILSGYDDLIENNLKRIKILEEMAQQTYEEWFVRMRFPGHESATINSETGLPEGWEKDFVSNQLGKVKSTTKIKSSEFQNEGRIPVIDQSRSFIAGFTNDKSALIEYVGVPYIVFGDHTRILKLINFDFARGADGTQIVVSKNPRMPQHLFYFSLLNIDLSNYHYARHYKYLKDSEIIIPTENIAKNFEQLAKKNFDAIQNLRNQNQRLREARDILMPRLMMGMVEV